MTNNDIIETIQQTAASEFPREACGVIIKKGKKSLAIPCENVNKEDPTQLFDLSPIDYSRAADQGEVIGIWHTHTHGSSEPSSADRVSCEIHGLPWYILGVMQDQGGNFVFDEIKTISPSGFEMPYEGRPYVPGIFDCWTVAIDYYKREFDIALNNYPYTMPDGSPGHAQFIDSWRQEGFVQVVDGSYEVGDIFFITTQMQTGKPDHAAVYVGDDRILHHCFRRLSCIDIYGGYWQKHTSFQIRHKERINAR